MKLVISLPLWFFVLLAVTCVGAGSPATREEVSAIIEESRAKKDPTLLHNLKGSSLDVLLPGLRELWSMGEYTTENWKNSRNAGREKEFLEMEASVNRDPKYSSEAYPIARDILISHPDFEWMMQTKLGRMTYVLNAEQSIRSSERSDEHTKANSDYPQELGFARRIPGDAAFRIIGPCLFSPYFETYMDIDAPISSPADWARGALSQLLKERYGEDLPKDIEAARAWWTANENRFAAKEDASPKSPNPSQNAPEKDSPIDSQNKPVSLQATDSPPASDVTARSIRWPIAVVMASALLVAIVWFLRKKG